MTADSRPRILPEAVLDAMPGAVAQVSQTGEVLGVNAIWRTLAGLSDLIPSTNVTTGSNYIAACDQAAAAGITSAHEAAAAVRTVLDGRETSATFEYAHTGRDATRWFELVVTRLDADGFRGALVRQVDISERKRLEAELAHAQKMESVGRLAGGIAHDFNNLLTVMIGYTELLHTSPEIPAALRPAVAEVLAAARRAAELTGRMLTFARKQRAQPRAVNVNDVVRDVERLLRRIHSGDVHVNLRLAATLPPVLVDPAQLEQVLMHLSANAREAMPRGGVLTIATDVVTSADEDAGRHPGLRPGPQVRVTVVDTGVGMDPDTLAHAFEPFFTTKDSAKASGLGLAMCYGIVKQANGFIGCESAKGAGTTCTVLLPAVTAAADVLTAASSPAASKWIEVPPRDRRSNFG